jgi:outer membrane biosynthesis protein TonB
MLEVLLESRHVKPPTPVVGAGVSAFAHVAIVAIIALASRHIVEDWRETSQQALQYLLPPDRTPKPEQQSIKYVARGHGEAPFGGDAGALKYRVNAASSRVRRAGEASARDKENSLASAVEDLPENTYSVLDVDTAVFRYEDSAAPAYPISMIARNISGYAKMQFIVDSSGVIDMSSVKTLSASHQEFAAAVRAAMPRMRYHPAKIGPRAVGQLAEQNFVFALKPAERTVAKKP